MRRRGEGLAGKPLPMKQDLAIAAAEEYAANWSVPWGPMTRAVKRRSWLRLFAVTEYTFAFESDHGTGEVDVACPGTVTRFEFFPTGASHFMVPLWAAYPGYTSVTIGWRMGDGEAYMYRWNEWYRGLSDERRSEYMKRFPTPEDADLGWDGFYGRIARASASS